MSVITQRSDVEADQNAPTNQDEKDLEKLDVSDPNEPPDGGSTAWLHVLLMHLVFFNTWGVANGYGIFQQYYSQTLNESQTSISWIGSLQVFFLFAVGAVTGRLTDGGHFRIVFTLGVFLQVLGLLMTSLAKTYWQILLSQAICLGLGNGCTFCPALAVLSQYFKKYRAVAVGLAAAGAAVGGLVYPVLMNSLIFERNVGFPWTLRIMAFVMLATYLPCLVWFKPRLPPRKTGPWVDWSAFTEMRFVLFTASMFLNFWGLYFAFFFLGTFARDKIGVSQPVNLIIVLNGVGIIGRAAPAAVAAKWTGPFNLLIPLSFASSLLVYCWTAVSSSTGLYAFSVVYGLVAAATQALLPGVATTLAPNPSMVGTRTGMILSIVSIANLTGPAICGALINMQDGSYEGAQLFAASAILLGAFAAVWARVSQTGMKLWVKI